MALVVNHVAAAMERRDIHARSMKTAWKVVMIGRRRTNIFKCCEKGICGRGEDVPHAVNCRQLEKGRWGKGQGLVLRTRTSHHC